MADWDKMATDYQPKYKDYAPEGVYTVKLDSVEIHEVGTNGSIAQDFKYQDGDYAYPKTTHWLSFKNDNWRMWHNKCLFELFGLDEDTAKKTVESCEKGSKEATVKAYSTAYTKLATKHPEVNIEIWQDGKYSKSEFTDNAVRMSHKDDDKKEDKSDDIFSSATVVTANDDDLPF